MFRDLFSNRLFIGGFAFFIFCVGGSLLYMQHVERETAREMAAHEEHIKQLTEKPKPTTVEAPVVEPPQQDGHVHADGTWHDGPHEPVVSEVPAAVETSEATDTVVDTPKPAMALTYHAELLATHPVEALRVQAEERGHWSAVYLPDIPPDDTEAAELARNLYLTIYYPSIGDTTHPEFLKAMRYKSEWSRKFTEEYEALADRREAMHYEEVFANSAAYQQYRAERARMNELHRIGWVLVSEKYAIALIGK